MKLPRRAQLVVGAAVVAGAGALALAASRLVDADLATHQLVFASVLGALVLFSWLRPLLVFIGDQSEAIQLDEGFFVILVLLVGPDLTVVTLAAATLVAQAVKRRPLVKSAFNSGQLVVSTGAAVAVFALLHGGGHVIDAGAIGAALAGAVVFYLANNAAVVAILSATGTPWRSSIFDGAEVRLRLDCGGVAVATASALVISAYAWAFPIAVLPLVVLRQVLAGHFQARRDRARLDGLFQATLAVHRSIGREEVTRGILDSARALLRCSDAGLDREGPADDALSATVPLRDDALVLSVSGRSRTEPFDGADQALLDALAAVGAGALSNAALYEEGRRQRERLSAITSSLGEGVCAVNRAGRVTFMNRSASAMLGWDLTDELDDFRLLPDAETGPVAPEFIVVSAMRAIATKETVASYDTPFERADGTLFDVACTVSPIMEGEAATGAVLVFRDISERKQLEEQLARHAFHDALTGLPNRRLFLDHLDYALRRSERSSERHAVLFCDVDRFKIVNDSLGHHTGDSLLIAISERIRSTLRPGDLLARFGGDEFTVLLEGVNEQDDAVAAAGRVLECLRQPIALPDGHEVVASLSIGIALTSPESTRDDVLRDADVAMYEAKGTGRGGSYVVFDVDAMGVRSAERIDLEGGLRRALERDEIEVFYQPLFSFDDRRVVAVEALVRWNHPERGLLSPEHFIGLAEDTGLIIPLGKVVLEKACRAARNWRERFGAVLSVGVNLSARQFQNSALLEEIEGMIGTSGIDPAQLCFEITESLAMDNVEQTNRVLSRLKGLGARVAIDDFGTGYSALGYLASFPIDVVKIDRSFVDGVDLDPVKSAIVSAVITMSKAIGSTTVVEGVETESQFELLRRLGCSVVQGYYLARPMEIDRVEELLATGHFARNTGETTELFEVA